MRKIVITIFLLLFVGWQIYLASHIESDLSHVSKPPHKIHEVFGVHIPFNGVNESTILNSWIVMGFLVLLSLLCLDRKPKLVPNRPQAFLEMIFEAFLKLAQDALGEKMGRKYLPYILTIFLFVLCSNWMALIPIPIFEEKPTRDLNTTLGLGILVFFVSHISGIKIKGFKGYVSHYFEPFIPIGGINFPNLLFAPIHIVGEVGKVVSHSFRLFGNIVGETIIIIVVSNLAHFFLLPPILHVYFIMLIGIIQAFVFTVLATIYLSIQVRHDDEHGEGEGEIVEDAALVNASSI